MATSKKGKKKKSSKRSVSFDALDDDDEVGCGQFLTLPMDGSMLKLVVRNVNCPGYVSLLPES